MRKLRPILLASFFFSLHGALVAYINSSMLDSILTPRATSIIFVISSALSILLITKAAKVVSRFGNTRYMASILILTAILLFGLSITSGHWTSILLFIPYFALGPLIYYGFDVFLEHFSDPKSTGNTRGIFLTLNNLAWIGMPALVGFLESRYGFGIVYFFAAFAVIAALITIFIGERKYKDAKYTHLSLSHMLSVFHKKSDIRGAIIINGLMQLFYVWMVIYTPLYLTQTLGFSWGVVGFIFSIMLLPFILFQYPVGRLVDRFSNEREFIATGLLIISIATIIFSLAGEVSITALTIILFCTRLGASIVDVSNESYFFKHVTDEDTTTIAVFRNMTPLAYLVGPVLGIILLSWGTYPVVFFILGLVMFAGSIFALKLHDIKKVTNREIE